MDIKEKSLKKHYEWRGKIEISPIAQVKSAEDLSIAYTPGVAQPCIEIQKDINKSYDLTRRWNTVAVITDGSAVLGLGDIGPEASMPVMEGKCLLFKAFGEVDAIPLCIRTKDVDEIVHTINLLSGSFGGINLEDIASPRCFEIERKLKESCDIPVFHDDQHGTAVVAAAALINSLKIVGKKMNEIKVVINGAGAAGIAIGNLFSCLGIENLIYCDKNGALYDGACGMNDAQANAAKNSNPNKERGNLSDIICNADLFLGVSRPEVLTKDMVKCMAKDPIVFAMANPTPEIMPDDAKKAGARIVGTGRSDFPNQINNVLVFPGIFRGALDARASDINEEMKLAAAYAIANVITEKELNEENILPCAFDIRVKESVAKAVIKAAIDSGVARIKQ